MKFDDGQYTRLLFCHCISHRTSFRAGVDHLETNNHLNPKKMSFNKSSLTRVPLKANPKYKKDGLKSYAYLLGKCMKEHSSFCWMDARRTQQHR